MWKLHVSSSLIIFGFGISTDDQLNPRKYVESKIVEDESRSEEEMLDTNSKDDAIEEHNSASDSDTEIAIVSKEPKFVEKDALNREKVVPLGKTFEDKKRILKAINKSIHSHYNGPWRSFSKVPVAVVNLWWSEFENKFFWEPHHGPFIKRNWRSKCGSHIGNVFNDCKRNGKRPKFVRKDYWKQILIEMASKEYKKICARNKLNRASKNRNGNASYAGGSKSTAEYAQEFKEKHGRDISHEELMRATYHSKRLKRWTGERPKKAVECYEEKRKIWLDSHQDLSKDDDFKLWCESVGGERKGMVFGQGSLYDKAEYVLNPPVIAPPPPPGSSPTHLSTPNHGLSPLARATSSQPHRSFTPTLGYSPAARGTSPQHRRSSTPVPGFAASARAPCPPPGPSQPPHTSRQFLHDRALSTTETQREEARIKAQYLELKAYEESLLRREWQMSQTTFPSTAPVDMQFQSLLINGDSDLCALTDNPVGHTNNSVFSSSFSHGADKNSSGL